MSETGRRRLTSWKEIAAHVGRDVRTVLRWEKDRGLPVHRVPGATGRVVFAYTDELDAWVHGGLPAEGSIPQPAAPAPDASAAPAPAIPQTSVPDRRLGWLAAAGIAIALGVVAWWASGHRDATTLAIRFDDNALVAAAADGVERWRHEFKRGETALLIPGRYDQPGDVFAGDIVAGTAYTTRTSDGLVRGGELLRFSPDGRIKGTFAFDDVARFAESYGPPWVITDFRVDHGSGAPRLVVAAHHNEWWPSTVTILDRQWQRRGTFVHAGWVERLHWLSADRIAIAGFSNAFDGGMLALLDANAIDGQSPAPHGSPFACASCGHGGPLRYVVVPRSEVNTVSASPFNRAVLLVKEGALLVRTIEAPPTDQAGAADALYEFTPALDLVRASYSDRYWEKHRELEAAGKITHTRNGCPDRSGPPPIRVWDPQTGWTPVATAPLRASSSQARSRP